MENPPSQGKTGLQTDSSRKGPASQAALFYFHDDLQSFANNVRDRVNQRIDQQVIEHGPELKQFLNFQVEPCLCESDRLDYITQNQFSGLVIDLHPRQSKSTPPDDSVTHDRALLRAERVKQGKAQMPPQQVQDLPEKDIDQAADEVLNHLKMLVDEQRKSNTILSNIKSLSFWGAFASILGVIIAFGSWNYDRKAEQRATAEPVPTASMQVVRNIKGYGKQFDQGQSTGAHFHPLNKHAPVVRTGHSFHIDSINFPETDRGFFVYIRTDGKVAVVPISNTRKDLPLGQISTKGVVTAMVLSIPHAQPSFETDKHTSRLNDQDWLVDTAQTVFQLRTDKHLGSSPYMSLSLAANQFVHWKGQGAEVFYTDELIRDGGFKFEIAESPGVSSWVEHVQSQLNALFGSEPGDWSVSGMTFRVNGSKEEDLASVYQEP